jgi:hypothetical protein
MVGCGGEVDPKSGEVAENMAFCCTTCSSQNVNYQFTTKPDPTTGKTTTYQVTGQQCKAGSTCTIFYPSTHAGACTTHTSWNESALPLPTITESCTCDEPHTTQ